MTFTFTCQAACRKEIPFGMGQLAGRGCKMCEERKRLVLFGPRSWTLDTYNDTGGCCSLSGTNYRRRETRRRLSCLLRVGQKATLWTAPAPILKRSFKSACTRPTGHSSRRLRMRLRGSGRDHSASVKPASDRLPRLVWKLYLGRTTVATVRRSNGPDSLSENQRYQLPINGLVSMGRRNTCPKGYLQVFQWLNLFASTYSKKTQPCLGLIEYSSKDQVSLKNTIGSTD
jgi:hypothetical protein